MKFILLIITILKNMSVMLSIFIIVQQIIHIYTHAHIKIHVQ